MRIDVEVLARYRGGHWRFMYLDIARYDSARSLAESVDLRMRAALQDEVVDEVAVDVFRGGRPMHAKQFTIHPPVDGRIATSAMEPLFQHLLGMAESWSALRNSGETMGKSDA